MMSRSEIVDDTGLLAPQRRALILDRVRRDGSVRVAELADRFGVSDMTVRRDLEVLARTGAIEKTYGGAVVSTLLEEPAFEAKSQWEPSAKEALARAAAALVEPGSVVAVGAGTTTFAVARHLLDIPDITLVTNSLPVANLVRTATEKSGSAPALLLTGGTPTPSAALVGPLADQTIRSLHVDVLIIGAHGISERAGLTTPNLAEAQTNRALIASAHEVVVVADHSKWNIVGLSAFASLSEIHYFVTDGELDPAAQLVLNETTGRLVLAQI
ncbi:DeoR/GlpR family DNA-binding transcription regulator [Streptomyces sp. BE20]|uniref:DeoR/GlpR family DNA-binding transcription regulator n=1 Tax=unclassified Streptomyces TaxID=2593676 RepID=UPI002E787512|nr:MULTISPECIES: DeoR/GlpR family DNA-binding transcription regulator [unclassified Streptomyces]MED7947429.1 DeoR/GlpR family DNA-binding transcription regulator [Streptomyces sp. BE303]MEE1820629.1 DeoR/GlpR family DNA-binding transcription regulator [Streptomyces sp. BE20]